MWTGNSGTTRYWIILRDLITDSNSFVFLSNPEFVHAPLL